MNGSGMAAAVRLSVPARMAGAVAGGYGLASLVAVALPLAFPGGPARAEAAVAGMMLGFPVWLGAILWACAAASVARMWGGLGGAAGIVIALAGLVRLAGAA